jgi:hypothetical protein
MYRDGTMSRVSEVLCFPVLLLPLALWSCGGGDLTLPQPVGPEVVIVDGDKQSAQPGARLAEPLIVRLVNERGEGIPDRGVVWVVTAGGGSINPATGTTDAEGYASAEWTLGGAVGAHRVEAQVPDIGSVSFTATAPDDGGGTTLRVEPVEDASSSAPAGSQLPVPPAVRVLDEQGDPVAGVTVSFAVTGGGGQVSGESQVTSGDGIARVGGWTLGVSPGTNTLEASVAGAVGSPVAFTAEGTSTAMEVDRLVYLVAPRDVEEDEPFSVQVALVDPDGNVVPLSGIFIYVALIPEGQDTPANDDLSGERFENTVDGVAVFDLRVLEEGRYRLRALTDDLPELGPHGPQPYLVSEVFEVD